MSGTNEGRLERIKQSESATDYLLGGTALKGDWKWLIEQAERVKELEKGNKQLLESLGGFVKAVEIYSGKPVDVAMKELIEYAKEVEEND